MPRPGKLHSRTGCLRCVARRKKCDERLPVCSDCQRIGLTCIWRGKNNLVTHLMSGNKVLNTTQAMMRVHDEQVDYPASPFAALNLSYPQKAVSCGHVPLRTETEHRLLQMLPGFLDMFILPRTRLLQPDYSHEYAVALQTSWVRNALVAFSAFVASARDSSLRLVAYENYQAAVRSVQQIVAWSTYTDVREELLIATLFLGLMEVMFTVLPSRHSNLAASSTTQRT